MTVGKVERPDASEALLLTLPQTQRATGLGRTTLYQLIREGRLKAVHIGRSIRVPRASLEQFVESL